MDRTKRIRGYTLQQIRAKWFKAHPLCAECERHRRIAVAVELDHIVPLFKGGKDVASNRQGLCHACHLAKSIAESGHRAAVHVGLDGYPVTNE